MTLSDDRVIEALNRDFVCAWTNSRPDVPPTTFPVLPPHTLRDWEKNFAPGTGANNVGLLFCSSNGWVLMELRGFLTPDGFLEELRFVLAARDEITRGSPTVTFDRAAQGMRERHQAAILSLQDRESRGRRPVRPRDLELALRIGHHQAGMREPLRRVESVHPEVARAARNRG